MGALVVVRGAPTQLTRYVYSLDTTNKDVAVVANPCTLVIEMNNTSE